MLERRPNQRNLLPTTSITITELQNNGLVVVTAIPAGPSLDFVSSRKGSIVFCTAVNNEGEVFTKQITKPSNPSV